MFKMFMLNIVPIMNGIGANISQVAQGTQSEMDSIVFVIALAVCSGGIVISFFKKNIGLVIVLSTIILFGAYFLLSPTLQTVQTLVGG